MAGEKKSPRNWGVFQTNKPCVYIQQPNSLNPLEIGECFRQTNHVYIFDNPIVLIP